MEGSGIEDGGFSEFYGPQMKGMKGIRIFSSPSSAANLVWAGPAAQTVAVVRFPLYSGRVIRSFRDRDTEAIFQRRFVKRSQAVAGVALRKLAQIDSAEELRDLGSPPANRLEALHGNRAGQYSIRINDQFRVCFKWKDGHAYDVEVTDYH